PLQTIFYRDACHVSVSFGINGAGLSMCVYASVWASRGGIHARGATTGRQNLVFAPTKVKNRRATADPLLPVSPALVSGAGLYPRERHLRRAAAAAARVDRRGGALPAH